MSLDFRAKALCTIHARMDASTARHIALRVGADELTHFTIEVWFGRHHELDGRALWLATTGHVITLCAYHALAPDTVHVLAEFHTNRIIARQFCWRAKLPKTLITPHKFTVEFDEDDTSQNLVVHDSRQVPPLRLTATYPRYVREDEPELLLSASMRRYQDAAGNVAAFAQRCTPVMTWTVQSHRASEFTHALGATLHEDFEAQITSVRLHHAPSLSLTRSTPS